jgi:hypothetical protein
MASVRRHGRNGQVYLSVTSGGVATPLPFQASWTMSKAVDKSEVTAFGDPNKVYVAGLPDSSGDFGGFMDAGTSQTYIAASDGLPRNFYLYWDAVNDPNSYWYGQILPDFSADGAVGGPVNFKSTWNASGPVTRYTAFGGMGT